jgi:hypothetical protein
MTERIKILFLAANPTDRARLELGSEFRAIQDALLRGKYRGRFKLLLPRLAVRIGDFTSALTREQPHIVHFSGHCSVEQGIAFEGTGRSSRPASREELTDLFKVLARNARLIFLNACHTHEQAAILSRIFDYTIGTSSRILDVDAREFSAAFYLALFDGETVPGAFQSAKSALDNRVRDVPVLSQRTTADNSVPFISQVLPRAKRRGNCGSVTFQTNVRDDAEVGSITNAQGGKVTVYLPSKPRRKD